MAARELEANDAGSPIAVMVRRRESPLSGFRPGDPGGPDGRVACDPAAMALEPLVEAERVRVLAGRRRRLAAETGAHWLRMLLTDFALVYGDDWFAVPFSAPVGSLVTVESVSVRDTFGVTSTVPPTAADGARRWAMYQLTTSASAPPQAAIPGPDSLLVVPSLPAVLSGSPLEETGFFRDEQANLVWAVERTTPSPLGTPVDRYCYSQPMIRVTVDVTDVGDADLVYRLTTPIPTNWYPYLPRSTPAGDDITLERLPARTPDGQIVTESSVIEDGRSAGVD